VLAWEWKLSEAEAEYCRAIELNPNYPASHSAYAIHLAAVRRFDQALFHARRAVELDPLLPRLRVSKGVVLYWAHRYEEAIDEMRKTIEQWPRLSLAHHLLGALYIEKDMYTQSVAEFEKALELSGANTFDLGFQGFAYGRTGNVDGARQILELLLMKSQQEYVAPLSLALVYLGLDDRERALTWVENAYAPGSSQWPYYLAVPLYDPIRVEIRFRNVMERIGLIQVDHQNP
jgi:tetratricopeptide (TPR) repeat protein